MLQIKPKGPLCRFCQRIASDDLKITITQSKQPIMRPKHIMLPPHQGKRQDGLERNQRPLVGFQLPTTI